MVSGLLEAVEMVQLRFGNEIEIGRWGEMGTREHKDKQPTTNNEQPTTNTKAQKEYLEQ